MVWPVVISELFGSKVLMTNTLEIAQSGRPIKDQLRGSAAKGLPVALASPRASEAWCPLYFRTWLRKRTCCAQRGI